MASHRLFARYRKKQTKQFIWISLAFALGMAWMSLCASAWSGTAPGLAEATTPDSAPESKINRQKPTDDPDVSTRIIPLPIYATLPNEGSTFGFMPVFLKVKSSTERTEAIYAPSVSYNDTIGTTGTARFFIYPNDHQTLDLVASASTKVNRGGYILWQDMPNQPGGWTDESFFRISRNVFFRFFGIGPETLDGSESSYTRLFAHSQWRRGYNITEYFNVGALVNIGRDVVQSIGVPDLPLAPVAFSGTPGMGGSSTLEEALSFRYDTRMNHDYATEGFYSDFDIGAVQGISNSPDYLKMQFESRLLVPETTWLNAGFRALWRYVNSPNVPFYQQSSLGGALLMRGFTEDRFIDQGAWTAEFEQRIRVLQTHIYGVTTDWRVDPFVAVGQVYGAGYSIVDDPQVTSGLGFRAFVRPNVLGRVDVAYAFGHGGVDTYVELGYPF